MTRHQCDFYFLGRYERARGKATDMQGLALHCQQKSDAFQPDYWQRCALKDDQQCPDPNDPTKTKKGLSSCWLKDVNRLIPSLFKCAVFDSTSSYHFHPNKYGFASNYNRPRCSVKAKLNATDPARRDLEFTCSPDDGNRKPDPSKAEVGWACVSFKEYNLPTDYLGGCVDQTAEKACGATKDGETVSYIKVEDSSYGLARAWAPCGSAGGQGACSKARRTCTGGTWLACDKCDNCPQNTPGQKTICPNGVWPADSCKRKAGPSAEICDGTDNDCDGQIDEGLPTKLYYPDKDNDGYGRGTPISKCAQQKPKGYIDRVGDCDDNDDTVNPGAADVCDGKDNNCNGQTDDGVTLVNFHKDDDSDGFRGAFAFKGCYKVGSNKTMICRGTNLCITTSYGASGAKYIPVDANSPDCCDSDKDARPGQMAYFGVKNKCGSWDYNCNKKTDYDPTYNLCQCSTAAKFRENAITSCQGLNGTECGGTKGRVRSQKVGHATS